MSLITKGGCLRGNSNSFVGRERSLSSIVMCVESGTMPIFVTRFSFGTMDKPLLTARVNSH